MTNVVRFIKQNIKGFHYCYKMELDDINNNTLFAWLISHQPTGTFLSEQTSHQQSASSTFLSEQTSTSHQPPAKRTGCKFTKFNIKWFSLLPFVKFIDLFKEAICETSS
jgi:hypothetical protein